MQVLLNSQSIAECQKNQDYRAKWRERRKVCSGVVLFSENMKRMIIRQCMYVDRTLANNYTTRRAITCSNYSKGAQRNLRFSQVIIKIQVFGIVSHWLCSFRRLQSDTNVRNVRDYATQHHISEDQNILWIASNKASCINPYPTAFPYGNGMVLHFYQQQESSTTKTVHKVINKGLKAYV